MTFNPGPKLAEPIRTRAQVEAPVAPLGGRDRAVRRRGDPPAAPRARRPHAGDRLLRRAVHPGRLPGARARARKASARSRRLLYREPATLEHLLERLSVAMIDYLRAADRRRRAGGADLRLVGRAALDRRLRAVRAALGAGHRRRRARPAACRSSTSSTAARTWSVRPPTPAPTCSGCAGACRSTSRRRSSDPTSPCRATSIRTCSSPIRPRSAARPTTSWRASADGPATS